MIWYSRWDTGCVLKNMDIGLATLRRDGFGSLSPKLTENDANFITSAFTAKQIAISVEGLTPKSQLHVQLLDHLDHPLDGFSLTLTTNGLHMPLKWLKLLPAHKIALRVNYPANSSAKIYAVRLND